MIEPGLSGKTAIVTGANNPFGIGAAIAEAFVAQGAAVFFTFLRESPEKYGIDPAQAQAAATPGNAFYRARNADAPDQVLARLRDRGGRAEAAEFDLSDPAAIPAMFDLAERLIGPVDVLVNNAAYGESDEIVFRQDAGADWANRHRRTVDAASHDRHFAVNSRAVALTMAEFARRHVLRGAIWGRIVNISTEGADGFPGEVSYGASKAALESYSRSAAVELAPLGITVNIVAPGPIQTGWIPPDAEPRIAREIPLGRIGQPADVADVVVFLASEQARWVTGQRLFVGGGHRI